jgi:hypothetical protein
VLSSATQKRARERKKEKAPSIKEKKPELALLPPFAAPHWKPGSRARSHLAWENQGSRVRCVKYKYNFSFLVSWSVCQFDLHTVAIAAYRTKTKEERERERGRERGREIKESERERGREKESEKERKSEKEREKERDTKKERKWEKEKRIEGEQETVLH